jgi:hypothetical protein
VQCDPLRRDGRKTLSHYRPPLPIRHMTPCPPIPGQWDRATELRSLRSAGALPIWLDVTCDLLNDNAGSGHPGENSFAPVVVARNVVGRRSVNDAG